MATSEILNLEALLKPISEENPVGIDLREDFSPTSKYYIIQDLRTDARAAERASAMDPSESNEVPGLANWKKILKEAPKCLEKEAKDLELAAWLTEALIRIHGFDGLLEGLQLLNQLVTQYGSQLYPRPDDDGVETQVAPVMGLSGVGAPGSLIAPINCTPLIELSDGTSYSAWNYLQATELEKIADAKARQDKINSGVVELAVIKTALEKVKESTLSATVLKLQACLDEVEQLTTIFHQLTQDPSLVAFGNLRQTLSSCLDVVKPQLDKLQAAENEKLMAESFADEFSGDDFAGNNGTSSSAMGRGEFPINPQVIATREEALRMLEKIVQFFRGHEPHSPISYGLEKIVSWANMSLPELINELIVDNNARHDFFRLTGIKPVQPEHPMQPGQQPGMGMGGMGMGGMGMGGSPFPGGNDNPMYPGMGGGGYPGMGGPPGMGDNSMFGNDF